MTQIQNIGTMKGYIKSVWFRWRFTLLLVLIGVFAMFGITHLIQSQTLQQATPPLHTFLQEGSTLSYYGDPASFETRYLDRFPGLPPPSMDNSESQPVSTIELKWVRLHGPNFTSQLSRYSGTLRVLRLDNVTIEGHLSHVELPLLTEFFLNQGAEPEETAAPDYILNHGPTPWLTSTLFFLPDPKGQDQGQSQVEKNDPSLFPRKAVSAYEKGLNVTVFLKGSVAYQMNPGWDEVRLDISNCSEVLQKLPKTYKLLTLGRCKDLKPGLISESVTFLNFYIVYVSSAQLSGILRGLPNLQEFYAEIPDGPVSLSLSDLSPKLRLLSISSMSILPERIPRPYPNIKEFYFGQENQYGWLEDRVTSLNESFFRSLPKLFPDLEKVGLFDIKDEERYIFLKSVLTLSKVKWILVENFARGVNDSSPIPELDSFLFVENELDRLGLPKEAADFVIEIAPDRSSKAREISHEEKLWYRFTYLGWCPIDSWPKFTYVQRIIENGGILGEFRRKKLQEEGESKRKS